MMSPNSATAEEGGYNGSQNQADDWWIARWSSWLSCIGGVTLGIVAVLGAALNILTISFSASLANLLQIFAATCILAVEGSSTVSFLSFAKPIGAIFEGKPLYVKTVFYALLTVIPITIGASLAVYLGFFISAAITALYAMIIIGRKGNLEDMRAAAAAGIQPKI